MTRFLNFHRTITCGLKADRNRFFADVARQPTDGAGVITIEAVRNTQNPGEPLHKCTALGIERREPLVPGGIRQRLGVITGYEGADQSILLVKTRNIEFQDQIAAQFVVLP